MSEPGGVAGADQVPSPVRNFPSSPARGCGTSPPAPSTKSVAPTISPIETDGAKACSGTIVRRVALLSNSIDPVFSLPQSAATEVSSVNKPLTGILAITPVAFVVMPSSMISADEQRSTEWMTYESLAEALDPSDPSQTIEGWPAPQRVVVLANAP